MKSDCSLDLFFTKNFFPFDLWIWISLIKSSFFPQPPQSPWYLLYPWPLSSAVWFFVVVWHRNFFFFLEHPQFLHYRNLPPPPVALPASLLVPPVSTGSRFPQCLLWGSVQALSHQLSAQAFIPPLYLLPVYASVPCRCKRSLMCTFPLVSLLLFTSPFLFFSLTSSLSFSSVPASSFLPLPWNNLNHSMFLLWSPSRCSHDLVLLNEAQKFGFLCA